MGIQNEARGKLTEALNVLIDRFNRSTDSNEQASIERAIEELHDIRATLNQQDLLDAANSIQQATIALERFVNSSRLGPFDDLLKAIEGVITRTNQLLRNGELSEPSPRAIEASGSASPAPATSTSTATADRSGHSQSPPTPPNLPTSPSVRNKPSPAVLTVNPSKDFVLLRSEYERIFENMTVKVELQSKVNWHVDQLLKNQRRYKSVSSNVNNIPWAMISVIQAMECGFNFSCHLHNGDPLTSRTKHVPAGKPATGNPPFAWENSAIDALKLAGLENVTDWSFPHMLYLLEKYNGFGYRNLKVPTPYLWSFSNQYEKGKYVADGQFDPEAVSRQCGAAVMLKALLDRGISLT
jgi:lysozyme family protein